MDGLWTRRWTRSVTHTQFEPNDAAQAIGGLQDPDAALTDPLLLKNEPLIRKDEPLVGTTVGTTTGTSLDTSLRTPVGTGDIKSDVAGLS